MKSIWLLWIFSLLSITLRSQLYVSTGAYINSRNNGQIVCENISLNNDGTIIQQKGDGHLVFSGTNNNAISGNGSTTIDILDNNKASASILQLLQSINIAGSINFVAGFLDLNGNNIYLAPNAFLNNERQDSRVTGVAGGYIEIMQNLNAPSSANPGNLGFVIDAGTNFGATTIRRGHSPQQVTNAAAGISRYFDVNTTFNLATNAMIRLNYFDGELNGLEENELHIYKSENGSSWADLGFTQRDATANFLSLSGVDHFSRWTLSVPVVPLPLHFISFDGQCKEGTVTLNWRTAQEQNTSRFEVQRYSSLSSGWQTISTLAAAGNSTLPRNYSFTDLSPVQQSIYRIAAYDLDNSFQLSSAIVTNCDGAAFSLKASPNPVAHILYVKLNAATQSPAHISIFAASGTVIKTLESNLHAGNNVIDVDMSGIARGVYLLRITWDNGQQSGSIKVVKS